MLAREETAKFNRKIPFYSIFLVAIVEKEISTTGVGPANRIETGIDHRSHASTRLPIHSPLSVQSWTVVDDLI